MKGIHLKGKTLQLLKDKTEYLISGSVLLTNCKTKSHKFTYVKIKIFCLSKDNIEVCVVVVVETPN